MWRLIEAAFGHETNRHLSGTEEVDEIYVSCRHKGEPESEPNPVQPLSAPTLGRGRGLRYGPGRGHADKDRPVVFVLVGRGGPRMIEAGASIDQGTLRPLFERCVAEGSRVCGEYARGDVHENTSECEIGLLQQFLLAHRGISMATLPSYLKLHQWPEYEQEILIREPL
jgi:hypothetical protein